MFTHQTKIRVRYSETDQMGFVYYGHYATYFEVGRVEAIRELGISYAHLEEEHGIFMPVKNMHVRFLRPAKYDELLTLTTTIRALPATDIVFETDIHSSNAKLCCAGRIALVFLDATTGKRIPVPDFLITKLSGYFG